MKRITKEYLQAGEWYLLYNPIIDTPFKEMLILRMKGSDESGEYFEKSVYRFCIWWNKYIISIERRNEPAILHKNVDYNNLFIYELSDEEIGVHVVAEEI